MYITPNKNSNNNNNNNNNKNKKKKKNKLAILDHGGRRRPCSISQFNWLKYICRFELH